MAYVIIYMNYLLIFSLYLVGLQINISTFHVTQSSASTSVINNSNILIIFYNFDCQCLLTLAFPQSLLLWISDISFHLEFIQVDFSLWSIKLYSPSLPKPLISLTQLCMSFLRLSNMLWRSKAHKCSCQILS